MTKPQRRDWMKDCLKDLTQKAGSPLTQQELKASFCDFCSQPECTRSLHGTTKFEKRVSNWRERLFTNVPSMDPKDPRFSDISAKGFVIIPPEALTSKATGNWIDPRDLAPVSVSVPETVKAEEPPLDVKEPPAPKPTVESRSVPREVILMNTPTQKGIMLPGGTRPESRPQRDAWDAPQPVKPGESVVQSGATVRFGVQADAATPKSDEGEST